MSTRAKFRLFRRTSGIFFLQDNTTGQQESLRTRDRNEAKRLFAARNEAHVQPGLNLQIARAYLNASDPKLVTRTWQEVMEQIVCLRSGPTQDRWRKTTLDHAYDPLRRLPLMETRAEHFLGALSNRRPATNAYLRRMHNFALNMDWLLRPVIPKAQWPQVVYKKKRAITAEEHARILAREGNPERRDFYELCWHLGGSQGDMACLQAENIDWQDGTITYGRQKLRNRTGASAARITIGDAMATVLKRRLASGPLIPYLRNVHAKDRASEFHQRCHGLPMPAYGSTITAPGFLGLWMLLMFLFAGVCLPSIPPGGVAWPYYALFVAVPAGARLVKRHPCPRLLLITYATVASCAVAAGLVFSDPIWQRNPAAVNDLPERLVRLGAISAALITVTLMASGTRPRWTAKRPPQ